MIYPGCKAMTEEDARRQRAINAANGWGISIRELKALGSKHRKAREANNWRTMERIEYRLEDINFHRECSMLAEGDYDGFNAACDEDE